MVTVSSLLACIFMIACGDGSHLVAIDDATISDMETVKTAVRAWEKQGHLFNFMKTSEIVGTIFNQPDITIIYDTNFDKNEFCFAICSVPDSAGKCCIHTKTMNKVIIAHEVGHALGLKDNTNYGSIMFPSLDTTNKDFSWFNEFK